MNTLDTVLDFSKSLASKKQGTWKDSYGTCEIYLGRNIVCNLLSNWDRNSLNYRVVISPVVNTLLPLVSGKILTDNPETKPDYILSIGGAREHNLAKEFLHTHRKNQKTVLVAVPVPLSNDSFGTNRSSAEYGKVEVSSRESVYPNEIFVDFELLRSLPYSLNAPGIGEVIGQYFSLQDYCNVRGMPIPNRLLIDLERSMTELEVYFRKNNGKYLELLAINLIKKCLIMRAVKDHQIGAGGDHLIAYALEYTSKQSDEYNPMKLNHGELVYLGSIIMSALFPEWEFGSFSLNTLIDFGRDPGFFPKALPILKSKLSENLIKSAIQMRSSRPTLLSTLSLEKVRNGHVRIAEKLKEKIDG